MKKIALLLILCVLSSTVLSGCWDYTEYENMAQIISMGVDYNKETHETTVTLQHVSTSVKGISGGSGGTTTKMGSTGIVHTATDKTLYGAMTKLQGVIPKKLFFGYLKVIVIGEDAAKYILMDLIEFFDRTAYLRSTIYLCITSGRAENVIATVDLSGTISGGDELYNLITLTDYTGTAFPITLQDFTAMLAIGGLEATAPRVISTIQYTNKPKAEGGTQGNIKFDEQGNGDIRIAGTAAFKEDKFIGWLDDKESMGFGWITGKRMLAYKYSELSKEDNTENIFYYHINESKSKIKVDMKDNAPVIHVNIKVIADLRKYYSHKGSEFLTPDEVKHIEKKLSDSIKSDIEAALEKSQKDFESDIFGFGFEFFRKYPKLWQTDYAKKWPDIFPNIPVYLSVDSKIINTGTNIKKLIIK